MDRNKLLFVLLTFGVSAAWADSPSTATFMNAMTVCGLGQQIKIDANLQGSLKSIYEGTGATGKLSTEIKTALGEKIVKETGASEGGIKLYMDCLDKFIK